MRMSPHLGKEISLRPQQDAGIITGRGLAPDLILSTKDHRQRLKRSALRRVFLTSRVSVQQNVMKSSDLLYTKALKVFPSHTQTHTRALVKWVKMQKTQNKTVARQGCHRGNDCLWVCIEKERYSDMCSCLGSMDNFKKTFPIVLFLKCKILKNRTTLYIYTKKTTPMQISFLFLCRKLI